MAEGNNLEKTENEVKVSGKSSKQTAKKKEKKSFFSKIAKFFRDYKGEMKKIVWCSKKDTIKNTSVVIVVVAIAAVFIALLDLGLSQLLAL